MPPGRRSKSRIDDRATQPNPDGADAPGFRTVKSVMRIGNETMQMGHLDDGSSNQWYGHQSMCSNAIEGEGRVPSLGCPSVGRQFRTPQLPHRLPCPGYRNTVRSAGQSAVL